jgi:hypothetical protein
MVWSMKVIATAKIIAARTRFLDLPPVVLLAVMVPSPEGHRPGAQGDERRPRSPDMRHRHHACCHEHDLIAGPGPESR